MVKRFFALALLLAALPCLSRAQTVQMRDARLSFEYPESWLVVSPQLARVYEPLLSGAGIDADALSGEMARLGVHSRAYSEDFSEWISVMTMQNDIAYDAFEIERATDEQRRTLKSRAQSNGLWETTGLRAQDVEWQREGGVYWLYVHYTRTVGDQMIGRGVRYMTVRNGQLVMLDWQTAGRRFTNADLRRFRAMLDGFVVTERLDEPVRTVSLTAEIPAETSTAVFTVEGTATAGASLTLTAPDEWGQPQLLALGEAGASGRFSLEAELSREGEYDLTLSAVKEGMLEATAQGRLTYSANTLPVSLSGLPEDGVVTSDTVKLTGETLAGVQMQLVTPYGLTRKRSDQAGAFAFELTTKEEGEYRYTLICDKDGYEQRRIAFTLNRVLTQEQTREETRGEAVGISYRELQRDLEKNRGQTVRIYGPVAEVSQSGDVQYVRMYYNKNAKGEWYNPVVVTAQEDMHAKAGDMLTVVASVDGVYEEQDENGDPVMVPRLSLLFVDAVE